MHTLEHSARLVRPSIRLWASPQAGVLLLAISLGVGSLTMYNGSFGDEADNLAVGRLLTQGFQLYRDIFSHHFPFPYYWIAAFFWLFGPSILVARLSLLAFQLIAFGAAMRVARLYLPIGLTALAWNLVGVFYYGNMVLYNSFEGLALTAILFITCAIVDGRVAPGWPPLVVVGVFVAVALLSDPVAMFPAGIAVAALTLSKARLRALLVVNVVAGGCGLLYLGYLCATGTFAVFYASTVTFNTAVYSKYYNTNPMRAYEMVDESRHAFYVFEQPRWEHPNSVAAVMEYSAADRWILSGMVYRIGVLLAVARLLIRGRLLAAGFLYLFVAALLVRSEVFLRSIPFVLGALSAMSLAVAAERPAAARWPPLRIVLMAVDIFGRAAMLMLLAIVVSRGVLFIHNHWDKLSYRTNFQSQLELANHVAWLACGQSVMVGFYPGNPYVYFFTGQRPVSKYLFMYPWVAEVGLNDVVGALAAPEQPLAVVFLDNQGEVWGRKNAAFLSPLHDYLQRHYKKIDDNYYRSPKLDQVCRAGQ